MDIRDQARPLDHPDHPRSRHRRPDLRPHRGDARRPDGRGRARSAALLAAPRHPYTRSLIAQPSLAAGRGRAAAAPSSAGAPAAAPLLDIEDLHVRFAERRPVRGERRASTPSNGVSLRVMPGETVGIVGESGSGKSTLARAILGLTPVIVGHDHASTAPTSLATAPRARRRCGARRRWSSRTRTTRSIPG